MSICICLLQEIYQRFHFFLTTVLQVYLGLFGHSNLISNISTQYLLFHLNGGLYITLIGWTGVSSQSGVKHTLGTSVFEVSILNKVKGQVEADDWRGRIVLFSLVLKCFVTHLEALNGAFWNRFEFIILFRFLMYSLCKSRLYSGYVFGSFFVCYKAFVTFEGRHFQWACQGTLCRTLHPRVPTPVREDADGDRNSTSCITL